jgi:hypothetical protein
MSSGPPEQSIASESKSVRTSVMNEDDNSNICELCESLIHEFENPDLRPTYSKLQAPERLHRTSSTPDCALCSRLLHLGTAYVRGEVGLTTSDGVKLLSWDSYTYGFRNINPHGRQWLQILPETDPAVAKIRSDQIRESIGEWDELSLPNIWLSRCLAEHEHCAPNIQPQQYPRRLQEIRVDKVYLIDCLKSRPRGPYVTLSHCWGAQPFPILTNDNIEIYYAGLAVTEFLPTFRHGILATQKLGLRYLWIDCYCIVQSDNTDLQLQLQDMSEIYSKAILNIGIGFAASPFEEHRQLYPRPNVMRLRPKARLGARSYFAIGFRTIGGEVKGFDTSNTTFLRAWCLQERLLCARMLHFSRSMFWECREMPLASENCPQGYTQALVNNDLRRPFTIPQKIVLCNTLDSREEEYQRLWARIVQNYSSMDLSRPNEDKLTAIGGAAKLVAQLMNDEYCAGFFRRSLISQLPWRRFSGSLAPKSHVWRAPSWSWASVDGSILPHICAGGTFANLLAVHLVHADPSNSFGSLLEGSLSIRGWMLEVNLGPHSKHQRIVSIVCHRCSHSIQVRFDHRQAPGAIALFLTHFQKSDTRQRKSLHANIEHYSD